MAKDFEKRVSIAEGQVPRVSGAPIFLTGFARSGTTWVNRLMWDYFDAGFVNEGQFIVKFGRHVQRYGDLRIAHNRERLLRDLAKDRFFSILSSNYDVDMDWGKIYRDSGSFAEVVKGILSQIAKQTGKHKIGSKYPVFGHHLDLLNDLFPDCMIIHVIRDGRDCALSHKHMTWGHQNTYSAAVHWRAYIQTTRRGSRGMQGRYLEIRYEDLLTEPEATMRTLERFITGTLEHGIARRFVMDRVSLRTDRIGRWRQAMPARSQAIFESVAGDTLEHCGYPLTGLVQRPSLFSRAGYVVHDKLTREGWNLARKVFKAIPERK